MATFHSVTSPRITVITPAFNIEDYIAETIEAVLAQTEGDFEYLIVDDGSTDATFAIAKSYAQRDSRIRAWTRPNAGSSAARNAAIREARGEFIAFCDGDDRWHHTFLERSLATLTAAPETVGATFCAFRWIDERGRVWGPVQAKKLGDYDANMNLAGHCPQGNGSSLLIRKKCFDEAGLFDEELFNCVDLDMWLKINTKSTAPLFRYIDEALVEWRVRPGAISANEAKRVAGLDEMFQRYGSYLKPESITEAYLWPATLALYAGEDERAARWLAEVKKNDSKFYFKSKHGLVLGVFAIVGPSNGRKLRGLARSALRTARKAGIKFRQLRK